MAPGQLGGDLRPRRSVWLRVEIVPQIRDAQPNITYPDVAQGARILLCTEVAALRNWRRMTRAGFLDAAALEELAEG